MTTKRSVLVGIALAIMAVLAFGVVSAQEGQEQESVFDNLAIPKNNGVLSCLRLRQAGMVLGAV